jgi:hypothetical protein
VNKDEMIAHALASSDPDMAEDVFAFFCDAVDSNEVPDARILDHLARGFRAILDGEKPSDALGLTRARGHKRARTLQQIDERHFDFALAVARRMKDGEKRDEAFDNVAAKENSSVPTVKRSWEVFGRIARKLI